jgi:hypothetical protein
MVINEFLPRAGTDWNGDGAVNVYDEFIEIKNNGPMTATWKVEADAPTHHPPHAACLACPASAPSSGLTTASCLKTAATRCGSSTCRAR